MKLLPSSYSNASSAFIIPHYSEDMDRMFIGDTINGLLKQTDSDWLAIIIDDASKKITVRNYLKKLREKYFPKIQVIFLDKNQGAGVCRNIGVSVALKQRCQIIHFNDADDISHPERVRIVKNVFTRCPYIGLVYSFFTVIDENNQPILGKKIPSSILEILESLTKSQPEGEDVWITMGTDTGYINKTSATSVRTAFAYQCPFPNARASEDFHTWLRLSAQGVCFKYLTSIPIQYRVPRFMKYQASRLRLGSNNFNKIKVCVDSDGFFKAIELAVARNKIKREEIADLKARFYRRLIRTMERERELSLVEQLTKKLNDISNKSSFCLQKEITYL
jgi:glycosyltransferase involved in cell wall biosynthesis